MFIRLENLSCIYRTGMLQEVQALQNVNLELPSGCLTAVLGETGSGKTTLIQHIGMLVKPTAGRVYFDGVEVSNRKNKKILQVIRQKIGYLFQNPYHQILEATVFEDIAYGPLGQGLPRQEVENRVVCAMEAVGLDLAEVGERSPFLLSGGQLRRVALAAVLALEPEVLILDEPFAGLDHRGRKLLVNLLTKIHRERRLSIILVTHSLEEVLPLVQKTVVLEKGRIAFEGAPRELLNWEGFQRCALCLPAVTQLMQKLERRGIPVRTDVLGLDEAGEVILNYLKGSSDD